MKTPNPTTSAAGWVAFLLAIAITADSLLYMRAHNTQGSSVALGFAGAFLSFAAAAFGISGYFGRDRQPPGPPG